MDRLCMSDACCAQAINRALCWPGEIKWLRRCMPVSLKDSAPQVALDFHSLREQYPAFFKSQIANKV